MKNICVFLMLSVSVLFTYGQNTELSETQRKDITTLIDQYSLARESRDTILLKKILTADIDQLVSTGEWRSGVSAAIEGMLKSAASNSGKRTLTVDRIRLMTRFAPL
jgi:hypothetical protein